MKFKYGKYVVKIKHRKIFILPYYFVIPDRYISKGYLLEEQAILKACKWIDKNG